MILFYVKGVAFKLQEKSIDLKNAMKVSEGKSCVFSFYKQKSHAPTDMPLTMAVSHCFIK